MKDPTEARAKIIAIIASLPEAQAVPKAGVHLSLEVRGKRFGWYMEDHHGDDRISLNCKAPKGVMNALAEANPAHHHIPQYCGHRGWVGVWLDQDDLDWEGVADVIIEAYRLTAPKRLQKTNPTS